MFSIHAPCLIYILIESSSPVLGLPGFASVPRLVTEHDSNCAVDRGCEAAPQQHVVWVEDVWRSVRLEGDISYARLGMSSTTILRRFSSRRAWLRLGILEEMLLGLTNLPPCSLPIMLLHQSLVVWHSVLSVDEAGARMSACY